MIYLGYLLLRFQDEEVFNEIETLRLEILKVSTKNKKSFFYRLVFNCTPPLIFNFLKKIKTKKPFLKSRKGLIALDLNETTQQ
jgi:hypothetical protein